MKSQTHTIIFHSAVVTDKKGRPYTIKYATQQNKSHKYNKKDKKWLDTTDAQSATTQKQTVQELPESPPEDTGKSDGTAKTFGATSALKKSGEPLMTSNHRK